MSVPIDDGRWQQLLDLCGFGRWTEALEVIKKTRAEGGDPVLLVAGAVCQLAIGDETSAVVSLCAAFENDRVLAADPQPLRSLLSTTPNATVTLMRLAAELFGRREKEFLLSLEPTGIPEPQRARSALQERLEAAESRCEELVTAGEWVHAVTMSARFLDEMRSTTPGESVDALELQAVRGRAEKLRTGVMARHAEYLLEKNDVAAATLVARRALSTLGPYHGRQQATEVRISVARLYIATGQIEEAMTFLTDAEREVETAEQRAIVAEALADAGDAGAAKGLTDLAATAYDRAASLFEESDKDGESSRILASALRAAAQKLRA